METILRNGLEKMNIPFSGEMLGSLLSFWNLLEEANRTTNLTAIRDPEQAARLHFLDCAALLKETDFTGRRVIDVGSGAGFPGIPLRILCPSVSLTTIDSVKKKVDFASGACKALELTDVRCIWGRVEELPELREKSDIAVSRAVAELDVLAELCLPQVKIGGLFLAMKGPDCDAEAKKADFAIRALGGKIREIHRYTIPETDVMHSVIIIEKQKKTPPQYPRRYAQIKKKPLSGV